MQFVLGSLEYGRYEVQPPERTFSEKRKKKKEKHQVLVLPLMQTHLSLSVAFVQPPWPLSPKSGAPHPKIPFDFGLGTHQRTDQGKFETDHLGTEHLGTWARWALHVTVAGHSTVHNTVLNTVSSPCLAVYFWSNPPIPRRTEAWTRLSVQRAHIWGNMDSMAEPAPAASHQPSLAHCQTRLSSSLMKGPRNSQAP